MTLTLLESKGIEESMEKTNNAEMLPVSCAADLHQSSLSTPTKRSGAQPLVETENR